MTTKYQLPITSYCRQLLTAVGDRFRGMFAAPFRGAFLCGCQLSPGHDGPEIILSCDSCSGTLGGSQTEPHISLHVIQGHPPPVHVERSQVHLGGGQSLLRGQAEPAKRFTVVAGSALSCGVEVPEVVLCVRKGLLGGQMEPAKRLRRIWGDSLTLQVHGTQFILRLRKSLERSLLIEAQCLGKVTGSSLAIAIHEGYTVLGDCQAL